jgi:hypothetical protein
VKNQYLKYVLYGLLGIIFLLVIAAAAFYFLMLKPRIDVVMTVGSAFTDTAEEGNVCQLEFEDGLRILLNLEEDDALDGMAYTEQSEADRVEFGYRSAGIWLRVPKISEKYYVLPWTDDVQSQIEKSALISMMNLTDEEQEELGTMLLKLRETLTEEQYDFNPTLLNRLLGLECLKADILDLYRGISFHRAGTEQITRDEETFACTKYELEIPEEYVKPLLKTDGAGNLLNALGDILGDMTLEVYICKGALVYVEVETSILNMPQVDVQKLLSGSFDEALFRAEAISVPLTGCISVKSDGILEIEAQTTIGDAFAEASCILKMTEIEVDVKFNQDEAINVFQAGKLRLLLEAQKWGSVIYGKDTD